MSWASTAGKIITGGLGALAGGLNSRGGTSSGSSTTTRTLPPEFQGAQNALLSSLLERLQNPSAGTEPIVAAGRNRINAGYAGVDQALRDRLLAGGVTGQSGKYGTAVRTAELGRLGALGNYEGDIASLILGRQDNTANLMMRLLGDVRGTSTAGSSTAPSNVLGGATSGGLETLTTLMTLDKMLRGTGGTATPSWGSGG